MLPPFFLDGCPAVRCAVCCCRRRCRRFHGRSDRAWIRAGTAGGGGARRGEGGGCATQAGQCVPCCWLVVVVVGGGGGADYYDVASGLGMIEKEGEVERNGGRNGEDGGRWRFQAQRGMRTTDDDETTTTRPTTMDEPLPVGIQREREQGWGASSRRRARGSRMDARTCEGEGQMR